MFVGANKQVVSSCTPANGLQIVSLQSPLKKQRIDVNLLSSPIKTPRFKNACTSSLSSAKHQDTDADGVAKHDPSAASTDKTSCGDELDLKLVGPAAIQTLRGRLHGREVALIFCGESHEDTIDLTREKSIMEPEEGWVAVASCSGFDPTQAFACHKSLTLAGAKRWAEELLQDDAVSRITGAHLVFEPNQDRPSKRGCARLFLPDVVNKPEIELKEHTLVFTWDDMDDEAREFNKQRLKEKHERMSVVAQDELIARRKVRRRRQEHIELFDDWLLRKASSRDYHLELILEAPVAASEVELHVDSSVGPAPPANPRILQLDADSDEDEDEKNTPGGGSFLDYLRRRVAIQMPSDRVHCIDPRGLGDADDDNLPDFLRGSFKALLPETLPHLDTEGKSSQEADDHSAPLPSWEAFFGGAADLLYYAPHVKADYTPFLVDCISSPDKLRKFFHSLYFKTVPEALSEIQLNEKTRPSSHIRSMVFQPPGSLVPRQRHTKLCHSGRQTVPVRTAPLGFYLKAKGCSPPRTWVSGLVQRLQNTGASKLVDAASAWYRRSVDRLLADPKGADVEGDNFAAWLRACHRDIYNDIDTSDPVKLKRRHLAQSKTYPQDKSKRYNIKDLRIPSVEQAFSEFVKYNASSTERDQVLSKIIVDSFQLRLVDLAMALKTLDIALSAPKDKPVVIVLYAGLDHTRNVVKFFRSQGFSSSGLARKGLVGKESPYEDDEKRCLKLHPYLQDLKMLFPIPKAFTDLLQTDDKKAKPKIRVKKGAQSRKRGGHSAYAKRRR